MGIGDGNSGGVVIVVVVVPLPLFMMYAFSVRVCRRVYLRVSRCNKQHERAQARKRKEACIFNVGTPCVSNFARVSYID